MSDEVVTEGVLRVPIAAPGDRGPFVDPGKGGGAGCAGGTAVPSKRKSGRPLGSKSKPGSKRTGPEPDPQKAWKRVAMSESAWAMLELARQPGESLGHCISRLVGLPLTDKEARELKRRPKGGVR